MKSVILIEPDEVVDRLAQLGLTADLLREAVAMGEAARNSCTANDAVLAAGFLAWARTTRGLRDLLVLKGWRVCRDGGLELVVSPDGSMAIVVATGDEATGRVKRNPKTKHSKGPATIAAIEANQFSFPFEELQTPVLGSASSTANRATWCLLVASEADEIRFELSLPSAIGDQDKVEAWSERIILPPIRRDGELTVSPVDQGPDIDIEVSRRVS